MLPQILIPVISSRYLHDTGSTQHFHPQSG
jgi:hypothetical protein